MYWLRCQKGLFYQTMRFAARSPIGWPIAPSHMHKGNCHVVGIPVRTCATISRRTTYLRT
jgi:hypothetical protein